MQRIWVTFTSDRMLSEGIKISAIIFYFWNCAKSVS